MSERLLFGKVLGALALSFGVFLSACDSTLPEEDELRLGSLLQAAQGGSLDGGLGSSVATGTTCNKSSDFASSCVYSPSGGSRDVVYSWTAPKSDRYRFTTEGSDFDTVLELRSASAPAQVLACGDDDPVTDALQATLDVDLVRGQQVLVVVDSYGMSCGNYALGISGQCGGCDTPPGSCHQPAGTCVNGTCAYSLRPAGSACNDGDACTTGDTCDSSGVCSGTAGGCNTTRRGMTWVQDPSDSCGQPRVSCNDCDPYQGDTLCTESRPLLCIKKDGASNCGPPSDFYNGWTGGTVALTPFLVRGTELTSLAAANSICASTFGTGYRMAEFHDGGGGWGWRAKGTLAPLSTPSSTHPRSGTPNRPNRFWVHINDQAANCWN